MNKEARIFVAGHQGLVGSALLQKLQSAGFSNLITGDRAELDLVNQAAVEQFFDRQSPEYVFLAAAKVGGIHANSAYPADFIRVNLQIQTNVIDAAYRSGTKKLVFLGSSCIYPKLAPQPISEDCLLTGPLEETNEAYAIAKIAGIEMCRAYQRQHGFNAISVMPPNLYGPGDNFSLEDSHVLPALIRKFYEAKEAGADEVVIWGTGKPRREFLYVDDLADACLFLMEHYDGEQLINVGWGEDVSIRELAELIGSVVGYSGQLVFDTSKPDGTLRKLLNVSKLRGLGWRAETTLRAGIESTYAWFLEHLDRYRYCDR
jgi:GDP-L-fucose synthase